MSDSISVREARKADDALATRDSSALFSFKGRISRATYWKIFLASTVFTVFGQVVAMKTTGSLDQGAIAYASRAIVYGVALWLGAATSAKRFHDFGESGWMSIVTFVPILNAVAYLYLGFKSGDYDANEYGEGPQDIKLL
jgi:uncharacterized membrane protein YhaH (DUF805 family)